MTETLGTLSLRAPSARSNRMVARMLHTPGVQRVIGRALALITFTGRRTGTVYTTPVSYRREGDTVIVLTKVGRRWWRNLVPEAPVRLRLAGHDLAGTAHAQVSDESDLTTIREALADRRFDAKAFGIALQKDGRPSEADTRTLLGQVVVVRIALSSTGH